MFGKSVYQKGMKLLSVILLSVSLSSCSTFGFFFDQLPFITTWQMDRMFDLNDEQEEMVEQGATEMQAWFVEEGFPKVIARLKTAKGLWRSEQYEEAALYFEAQVDLSIQEFLNAVTSKFIPLLMTFDEENAKRYREYNEDKTEDWFEYAKSQASKTESRVERLKNWFGKLDEGQLRQVEELAILLPNEMAIRLENNTYWVERFLESALSRDQEGLAQWLSDPSIWWQPAYAELKQENRKQTQALVSMMINTMNERQQKKVVDQVDDWIDNLEDVL